MEEMDEVELLLFEGCMYIMEERWKSEERCQYCWLL